ncbi:MAG: [protein-PII] uridylyltransferase, partial [Proteobacteria bacterium]|nr:[protein-PII] uridylyltransferase [Pseudomonadota bacterium]
MTPHPEDLVDQALNLSRKFQSAPLSGDLICSPDEIYNAKKIRGKIRAAAKAGDGTDLRSAIAAILRTAYTAGRIAIEAAYKQAPFETHKATTSYTFLTDKIVCQAFDAATKILHPNPKPDRQDYLCLMAVGGYGRAEMAPFSDVDLLFLTAGNLSDWVETAIETTLYILWDIKLKVGHATRSVEECVSLSKDDLTIRTSLLECRYLAGKKTLSNTLDKRLWKALFRKTGPEFVE